MIPNLFVLSSTGEILIERQWRSKHKRTVCDLYWEESVSPSQLIYQPIDESSSALSNASKEGEETVTIQRNPAINRSDLPPIISTPRLTFVSILKNRLTFLSVSDTENDSVSFLLEFLQKVVSVLTAYITDVTETSLRDHFATVYQLLDEMCDGGYAGITELNALKECVPVPTLTNKLIAAVQSVTDQPATQSINPPSVVSKIPWRANNVRYVQNEIYFDLVEQLDCMLTAQGSVLSASVYGEICCSCRLSGVPDLTLTFTRPALIEDASLHRCVRIARYTKERCLSFVPPDGDFVLASYRVPGQQIGTLPVYVKPHISFRGTNGRVQIMMGSKLPAEKPVTNCAVSWFFPVPVKSHTITANVGTFRIDAITGRARWDIGRLPKDMTPMLQGNCVLEQDVGSGHHEIPIVDAEFTCKLVTASGLKVEGLAVRNVNYAKPFKGVRSVTQAGKFQIRCID